VVSAVEPLPPREPDRALDPPPPAVWVVERGLSTAPQRPPVGVEAFLVAAATGLELEPETLTAPGSSHAITRLRSLVAALAVERWRLRPVDPAPLFGRLADVVSRWVRWGVAHRQQDAEFREAYDRLDERLCSRFDETPPSPESRATQKCENAGPGTDGYRRVPRSHFHNWVQPRLGIASDLMRTSGSTIQQL
jgi:hypothetical protein